MAKKSVSKFRNYEEAKESFRASIIERPFKTEEIDMFDRNGRVISEFGPVWQLRVNIPLVERVLIVPLYSSVVPSDNNIEVGGLRPELKREIDRPMGANLLTRSLIQTYSKMLGWDTSRIRSMRDYDTLGDAADVVATCAVGKDIISGASKWAIFRLPRLKYKKTVEVDGRVVRTETVFSAILINLNISSDDQLVKAWVSEVRQTVTNYIGNDNMRDELFAIEVDGDLFSLPSDDCDGDDANVAPEKEDDKEVVKPNHPTEPPLKQHSLDQQVAYANLRKAQVSSEATIPGTLTQFMVNVKLTSGDTLPDAKMIMPVVADSEADAEKEAARLIGLYLNKDLEYEVYATAKFKRTYTFDTEVKVESKKSLFGR